MPFTDPSEAAAAATPEFIDPSEHPDTLKRPVNAGAIFLALTILAVAGLMVWYFLAVRAARTCDGCPDDVPGYNVYNGAKALHGVPMTLTSGAAPIIVAKPTEIYRGLTIKNDRCGTPK